MTSPNDPIDRLAVDLEIFGIPQSPDMPPMTETYLHVRRRQDTGTGRAVLGLPVYKGDKGDTGPAGMRHQGDRTTAELDGLSLVLGENELNFTYRNTDDNSQWVWNGDTFVVYRNAYGAKGDTGPAPEMTGGTLSIDGEIQPAPFAITVDGSPGGPYTVSAALPELPEGPPGPPGPSGSVYDSVDVTGSPLDGDTLVHDSETGKLVWTPLAQSMAVKEYVVPPQNFPTVDKGSADVRHVLCSVTIPAQPYAYRIDVAGGVDVNAKIGHQIDVEVRVGDAVTGEIIGYGRGQDGEGWREVALRSHSEVAIIPGSEVQVIPANQEVTVYASAVKKAGVIFGWGVRRDRANLRLRLMAVA
ncbi:hypothetical protein [Rhodococcus pyridinivorans]|uniref:Minor tail protein n=1 Tax=Rhodococcus pyridinivorans TaxID=103816 RepID=A0A7M2XNN6_9NOCA|nr:hypothetical protein [Rhodococcus pyridinivorans]QOV99496.1 hypothetical protein INP59_03580 [Rhodococcus pyridinivorans]